MMIQCAEQKDINELYALQLLAFESEAEMIGSRSIPALLESYEEAFADFENWMVFKTINENGKIVGSIRCKVRDNIVEISRLMVHPEYRCQCIGRNLLKEIEKRFPGKILELYTCSKSITNIRLYEYVGYQAYKEERGNQDLSFVYMRKNLMLYK